VGKTVDSRCRAFQLALTVLGRPWTALILNLLHDGPLRFSEIAERARGLGDKVLSARLKDLETRRLLVRQVEPGPPVRVSYHLTEQGQAFGQVAQAIDRWGHQLAQEVPGANEDRPRRPRRARPSR
jgi:DNA-binding HxlR family transcriptional regulator